MQEPLHITGVCSPEMPMALGNWIIKRQQPVDITFAQPPVSIEFANPVRGSELHLLHRLSLMVLLHVVVVRQQTQRMRYAPQVIHWQAADGDCRHGAHMGVLHHRIIRCLFHLQPGKSN